MKRFLQVAVCMIPVCAVAQQGTYSLHDIGTYDIHQVKKGETLYGLSRLYRTTVPALLELNPAIVNNNLRTGSTLKVPRLQPAPEKTPEPAYNGIGPKPYLVPVYYEVAKGETLYSISKKTDNDVEVVKLWNDLTTNDIKPGQKLVVGYAENTQTIVGKPRVIDPVTGIATEITDINVADSRSSETAKPATGTAAVKPATAAATKPKETVSTVANAPATSTRPAPANTNSPATPAPDKANASNAVATTSTHAVATPVAAAASKPATADAETRAAKPVTAYDSNPVNAKLVFVNEKGICTWTRTTGDGNSYFALHPTAPIGSTVSVKNMMNNRSVQVKVIGRLPNTPENENVAIKISGPAAKQLNALDSKFLVQLSYMGYEKPKSL